MNHVVLIAVIALAPTIYAIGQSKELRPTLPAEGRKMALVIGNGNYPTAALTNPANDSRDIRLALQAKGFDVNDKCCDNLGKREFDKTVGDWIGRLQPGDAAVFYFSGHGMRVDNSDYLIPIDWSRLYTQADLRYEAYDVARIQDEMRDRGATVTVIILDACRTNPFALDKGWEQGLTPIEPSFGSMILFAASPGHTADNNGTGSHSRFTEELLGELSAPKVSLLTLAQRVKQRVFEATRHAQVPYSADNMIYDLTLVDRSAIATEPTNLPSTAANIDNVKNNVQPASSVPPREPLGANEAPSASPQITSSGRVACGIFSYLDTLDLFATQDGHEIAGSVACGQRVEIVSTIADGTNNDRWLRVRTISGAEGWIAPTFVGPSNETTALQPPQKAYVDCRALGNRKTLTLFHSDGHASESSVMCSTYVSIIDRDGDRSLVRTSGGRQGWIQSAYLKDSR